MHTLKHTNPFPSNDLISEIKRFLVSDGVVLIKKLNSANNSKLLIEIARAIGKISVVGINVPENDLEDMVIHNIDNRKEPVKDKYGFVIQSTTNYHFATHTDDYFSQNPIDVVMFHCINQSKVGGATNICYLDELVLC